MDKPTLEIIISHEYSLDKLTKELLPLLSHPNSKVLIDPKNDSGGNTSVLLYSNDPLDLFAVLSWMRENEVHPFQKPQQKEFWGVSSGDRMYGAGDLIKGSDWKKDSEGMYFVQDEDADWCEVLNIFTLEHNIPTIVR
jgi:hypothetical protein